MIKYNSPTLETRYIIIVTAASVLLLIAGYLGIKHFVRQKRTSSGSASLMEKGDPKDCGMMDLTASPSTQYSQYSSSTSYKSGIGKLEEGKAPSILSFGGHGNSVLQGLTRSSTKKISGYRTKILGNEHIEYPSPAEGEEGSKLFIMNSPARRKNSKTTITFLMASSSSVSSSMVSVSGDHFIGTQVPIQATDAGSDSSSRYSAAMSEHRIEVPLPCLPPLAFHQSPPYNMEPADADINQKSFPTTTRIWDEPAHSTKLAGGKGANPGTLVLEVPLERASPRMNGESTFCQFDITVPAPCLTPNEKTQTQEKALDALMEAARIREKSVRGSCTINPTSGTYLASVPSSHGPSSPRSPAMVPAPRLWEEEIQEMEKQLRCEQTYNSYRVWL